MRPARRSLPPARSSTRCRRPPKVDGVTAEPFALASTRPLRPLENPRPTLAVQALPAARPGRPQTVTATVGNPSRDLDGDGAQVSLQLPVGVVLAPGSPPQSRSLGTLGRGAPRTVTWTVLGTRDGAHSLGVEARDSRYGAVFTTRAGRALRIDGTPPAVTVQRPRALSPRPTILVRWQGRDAGVGLGGYDVGVSADRAPYRRLRSGVRATGLGFRARRGVAYRYRVRAFDAVGNASPWVASASVTVFGTRDPRLRLTGLRADRRSVLVLGQARRGMRRRVRFTLVARRRDGRSLVVRRRARPRHGRLRARMTIPRAADPRRRLRVNARYPGDARYRPARAGRSTAR